MGGACRQGAWLQRGARVREVILGGLTSFGRGHEAVQSEAKLRERRGLRGAPPGHALLPSPTAAMGPPGTLGLVLLMLVPGAATAAGECSECFPGPGPIAALVAADVIITLLIAGGAYWLAGQGLRAPPKPRPPEQDSHYQELQGARGDLYSELKR